MAYQQPNQGFILNSQGQPGTGGSAIRGSGGPGVYNYGGSYNSGNYDGNNYPEQRSTYADNVQAHSQVQVGKDYQDQRFAGYTRKIRDDLDGYKYNIYSIMDEPWNRCCADGKCGTFPGNEGIAKDHTVTKWL